MTYKTRGIVIKRINLGEADRIITFYTATVGKMRAKALGVRKTESKLAGHLEPFMLIDLIFAKGRNIDVVTSVQILNSFSNLRKNLKKTSFAYFIGELIEKLVPEELKDTRVFNLLLKTLEILNSGSLPLQKSLSRACRGRESERDFYSILLLSFEIKLLDLLGFAPQISRCIHCAKGDLSKCYFSAVLGGILCEKCKTYDRLAMPITSHEIELVHLLRSPEIYQNLNLENFKINFDLISHLSQKIDYFMRFIFGKNIKSSQFIKQVAMLGG